MIAPTLLVISIHHEFRLVSYVVTFEIESINDRRSVLNGDQIGLKTFYGNS